MDGDSFGRVIYLGILVAAVGGYLLIEFRGRMGQMLRGLMSWGLIIVGLMAGYGLWNDMNLQRPMGQVTASEGQVILPRAPDGHYYLELQIAGVPIEFMVDTGATAMVLTRDDARKLGFNPDELAYLGTAQTANGTVRTSIVKLTDVRLGDFTDATFRASVNDGEMDGSLLGMDYLGQFHVEIADDRMTLSR